METKPTPEHAWLMQLVGEWTYQGSCVMGPDQEPMTGTGRDAFQVETADETAFPSGLFQFQITSAIDQSSPMLTEIRPWAQPRASNHGPEAEQ